MSRPGSFFPLMILPVGNNTVRSVEIRTLVPADAASLAGLLATQTAQYLAHFSPFAFDMETISKAIGSAKKDQYWALLFGGELAGFCMLRGMDQGYARPSFGVFVAERFSGRGIAQKALEQSLQWCTRNSIPEVMLKVAEVNDAAKTVYERAGFRPQGLCPETGQLLYVKALAQF